jgi:ATP:corrinoid adenosyltransferase
MSNNNTLVKLAGSPTNSLTGTNNPKTGLLTITFGNGNGKATATATGAVLQNETNAAGFFLGKTNAGSFLLQP